MGIFDKFKSMYGQSKKKTVAPKHVVKDGDAKKKQFMNVGSADEKPKEATEQKSEQKDTAKKEKKVSVTGIAPRILIRPLVTEKISMQPSTYAFEVDPEANRSQVKAAVYQLYGIRPERVNIIAMSGKAVRYGRTSGVTKYWKKAVVTLPAGKTIEVFE